ncbi:hypothetical protein G6F46_005756 [Rhizopus delemar]|uniref:3-hydroxyisobutyryl-CoA hydrolase n=2 Tax=Rhizopus TaxID=4842 RepID=A0A9P7CQJ2_9FUNG|nr:hypothetical protein G6F55_003789 [Rhizopus delemar]KAG1544854.1 hypothetical protein G6F51_005812 [Rhizopus arrhizus]KAG1498492.1 hypothetical protein G6F54_005046 [Rhizopus delemar]KAG1512226.1 hypothetical protein G6F53_005344 [Rhizopus delemar]KAG1527091.1 hypothetical protein G6F52_001847 [Rhizopus delemar]
MVAPLHVKYFFEDKASEDQILYERANKMRLLTLNRPKKLNSLDTSLVLHLLRYLKTCEFSRDIKLVLLKGSGKTFCAGGDLKHVADMFLDAPDAYTALSNIRNYSQIYGILHLLATMTTPVVTMMDGITYGAGCAISAFSQFRIATENTCLAMPETVIGAFCDMGSSYFMSRLDCNLGVYLALTGRSLKGEDVYLSGFATHFVHSSKLKDLEACLAEITDYDLESINCIIEEFAVDRNHKPSNYTMHGELLEKINDWFHYDTVEEIIDALRKDGSDFALKTANTILSHSPTGLKITLESYRRGKAMSIIECFKMETRIWHVYPYLPDFKNGVSTRLVEKKLPQWSPSTLEEIDLELDIRARIFHSFSHWTFDLVYEKDYFERPFEFTLPNEKEILDAQLVYGLNTIEKATRWFQENNTIATSITLLQDSKLY